MQYEALTEKLVQRYNGETVMLNEFGPVIGAFARVFLPLATAYGVTRYFDGVIPDWAKNMSNEWWWRGISLFDPTGLMSYPYVATAWDEWERNPDDEWAAAKYVLSLLATIPGMGIGARMITKLATLPLMPLRWFSRLFRYSGNMVNKSTKLVDDVLPLAIAKASGTTYKGANAGVALQKALQKGFGIKITDDAIVAAAKRNGISLGRLFGGGSAAVAKTISGAGKFLKPVGSVGRTVTAITGASGNQQDQQSAIDMLQKALNTPRTPAVYGSKIGFGQIGGKVQY